MTTHWEDPLAVGAPSSGLDRPSEAWRAHVGRVAWPTVALAGGVALSAALTIYSVTAGWLPLVIGSVLSTVHAYVAFTIMHEASHGNIDGGHRSWSLVEEALGWLAGGFLFVPYSGFRVIHLIHHAHVNDPEKDPDHWVVASSPLAVLARCFTVPLFYYYTMLWGPAANEKAVREARGSSIAVLLLWLMLFAMLCIAGFGKLAVALWLGPALVATALLALAFDWLPHHPHGSQDAYQSTRILLVRGLTLPMLWQNYHLIHHLYPRVPFYLYGQCFREARRHLEESGAPIEGYEAGLSRPFATRSKSTASAEDLATVVAVDHPTDDSVSIRFEWPAHFGAVRHQAGQYVMVELPVAGAPMRRCYSLFTTPGAIPGICVKRVRGGRVSSWLKQHAKIGMRLRVRRPCGTFTYSPTERLRHLLLVAGGSGITPIRSILETALANGDRVTLVYGNRSERDVIFRAELEQLSRRHHDQLALVMMLSKPVSRDVSIRGHQNTRWTTGLLTPERLAQELADASAFDDVYVCGPGPVMDAVAELAKAWEIPANRLHIERFVAPSRSVPSKSEPDVPVTFRIRDDKPRLVMARGDEPILDAALRAGVPVAYSCRSGRCGTCMVKVTSGAIEHADAEAILPSERARGLALLCCATAQGPVDIEPAT